MILDQIDDEKWSLSPERFRNPFDPSFYDFHFRGDRDEFVRLIRSAIELGNVRLTGEP